MSGIWRLCTSFSRYGTGTCSSIGTGIGTCSSIGTSIGSGTGIGAGA